MCWFDTGDRGRQKASSSADADAGSVLRTGFVFLLNLNPERREEKREELDGIPERHLPRRDMLEYLPIWNYYWAGDPGVVLDFSGLPRKSVIGLASLSARLTEWAVLIVPCHESLIH